MSHRKDTSVVATRVTLTRMTVQYYELNEGLRRDSAEWIHLIQSTSNCVRGTFDIHKRL
jgi:hypothetical protein